MALTYPLKKKNHEHVALYIITVINNKKFMTFSKKNKYSIYIYNIPTFTITHTLKHMRTCTHTHTHRAAEEMAATASSLSC